MFSGNEWLIIVVILLALVVPAAAIVTIAVVAARRPGRAAPVPPSAAGAGWFGDPTGRHEMRYWDGARWTDAVSSGGVPATDPL